MQGQIFLKGGGWHFSHFLFSSFIIFTFRNSFAELCHAFEEKIFFCHHNFMTKDHSKLSKNESKNIP